MYTDAAYLFIDSEKVPVHMVDLLSRANVQLKRYEDIIISLQEIEQQVVTGKVWIDGNSANLAVFK